MNSTVNGDDGSRLGGGEDAAFFKRDSVHLSIVYYDQFDDLGVAADFLDRTGTFRTQRGKFRHWFGPQVVNHQIKTRCSQVYGHRLAHVAEADESNACCHGKLSL